jgi:alanine racemase
MDMLMVNLGPLNGPGANIKVGDYATLYGPGGPSLEATAKVSLIYLYIYIYIIIIIIIIINYEKK